MDRDRKGLREKKDMERGRERTGSVQREQGEGKGRKRVAEEDTMRER